MRQQLRAATYRGRASSWVDDTVDTRDGSKPVLKVTFDIDGESDRPEWTCWVDDLYNREGQPSSNLKGLLALGVTIEDVQAWLSSGELRGLDRNDVDLVVEHNDRGYAYVRWVNGPRELRAQKPLDRGTKAQIAQRMLGALAKSGAPAAAPPQQPGRLEPPPRPTAPKGVGGFCQDCGTAKGPNGEQRCECVPF